MAVSVEVLEAVHSKPSWQGEQRRGPAPPAERPRSSKKPSWQTQSVWSVLPSPSVVEFAKQGTHAVPWLVRSTPGLERLAYEPVLQLNAWPAEHQPAVHSVWLVCIDGSAASVGACGSDTSVNVS